MKKVLKALAVLVVLGGAAYAGYYFYNQNAAKVEAAVECTDSLCCEKTDSLTNTDTLVKE